MAVRILFLFLFSSLAAQEFPLANPLPIHEAFVPQFTDVASLPTTQKSPPASISENAPPQPNSDLVWIPGYWEWSQQRNDFIWTCGVWRRPPPNQKWTPGAWRNIEGGWVREQGFWSSLDKLPTFSKKPPNAIEDKVPKSPGDNYFWVPGFWAFSYDQNDYVWLSGKWEQFHESWVLAPASYVFRDSSYTFVPAYWDWALKDRGLAYFCNQYIGPIVIPHKDIVHHLYSFYPSYLTFYWHCWHFHPNWWDGCRCMPTWWNWPEWWTFSWNTMWGCWWWWGNPGSTPPAWITYDISREIAPPSYAVIDLFTRIPHPPFTVKEGSQPLSPLGPSGAFGSKNVPKPVIASEVTPAGTVKLPALPIKQGAQVTWQTVPKEKQVSLPKSSKDAYYPGDKTAYDPRFTDTPQQLPSKNKPSSTPNGTSWPPSHDPNRGISNSPKVS